MSLVPTNVAESLTRWHVDPSVLLLLAVAAGVYAAGYRNALRRGRRRLGPGPPIAYSAGLVSLAVALLGPPDALNGVWFTAHMSQHLLLTLVAPPLLLLGRPLPVLLGALPVRPVRVILRLTAAPRVGHSLMSFLAHPLCAWLLSAGALLAWHLPGFYQAALDETPVHLLEHASLFLTAVLFWWVVLMPFAPRLRRSPIAALLLLFAAWMTSDLLGAVLTLSPGVIYPHYAERVPAAGWDALTDQRIGGLLMWVGGGVLYAVMMISQVVAPYARPSRSVLRASGAGKVVPEARARPTAAGLNSLSGTRAS